MPKKKLNVLINLPPTFFTSTTCKKIFSRLSPYATLRRRSHDTHEQIAADLSWADAILMWSWPVLDDAHLLLSPHLQFVGMIGATAPMARACLKRKIATSEVRHCWSPAVAEFALTLMLSGLRKTSHYHHVMKTGQEDWVSAFPADVDPSERELTGAAVGLVGFGGVGQRLAELLRPFNPALKVFDPYVPAAVLQQHHAKRTNLKTLVSTSDIVVLCAANTAEAKHLIDAKLVAAFRKQCVLVNVGRSSLIDMDALLRRLQRNDMTAMLDVFDREPLPKNAPLRKLPNVYLTPHRAGGLWASIERGLGWLVDDFEAHLAGRARQYAVTKKSLVCYPES